MIIRDFLVRRRRIIAEPTDPASLLFISGCQILLFIGYTQTDDKIDYGWVLAASFAAWGLLGLLKAWARHTHREDDDNDHP